MTYIHQRCRAIDLHVHKRLRGRLAAVALVVTGLAIACSSTSDSRFETPATASPTRPAPGIEPAVPVTGNEIVPVGPDEFAEAQNIPFAECDTLPEPGEPEFSRLQEIRDDLSAAGMFEQHSIDGISGPGSTQGILNVRMRRRFQPSIDWLADRVDTADLCLSLPPVGYYDWPFEYAVWEIDPQAPPIADDQRDIPLLIESLEQACGSHPDGRVLEPVITYEPDTITVTIPLNHVSWGFHSCEGRPPMAYVLTLSEDPAGRTLVPG